MVQERPGRIDYLYLTAPEKRAVEALDDAIDDLPPLTRLRCRTPEIKEENGRQIIHFPHMDFDERTPPTENEADLMCKTSGRMCPVAATCLKLGLAIEADHGVWGGRVLVDGEDYYQHKEETND